MSGLARNHFVAKADNRLLLLNTFITRIVLKTGEIEVKIVLAKVEAKPRVSLTAPNRDYFEQVSLTVLDFFWTQLPKLIN